MPVRTSTKLIIDTKGRRAFYKEHRTKKFAVLQMYVQNSENRNVSLCMIIAHTRLRTLKNQPLYKKIRVTTVYKFGKFNYNRDKLLTGLDLASSCRTFSEASICCLST